MHCKGGGHYPECGRPQEGGCKLMDMCGHGVGGGQKSRKKLRTSFVNGPISVFYLFLTSRAKGQQNKRHLPYLNPR